MNVYTKAALKTLSLFGAVAVLIATTALIYWVRWWLVVVLAIVLLIVGTYGQALADVIHEAERKGKPPQS